MIIETKEASVESDVDFGETEYMGVSDDPESLIHLMSLLTNLYNDPELAVIREYYTNALDSHEESGQTRPVDVYLPTRDNPVYVVKDYGIGMSREDISKIYKMYGVSTKRRTNKQRGAFGLGCKSALAIATQFTLTAIKGGIKTTALISKTESGLISVDYLPERPTEDPNGVTVTIPVPNPYTFNEKVKKFFRYSDPSGVLINGEHPATFRDGAEPLDINVPGVELFIKRSDGWSSGLKYVAIMGDVGYEISNAQMLESLERTGLTDFDLDEVRTSLYFMVGIGDVDLTPNREGLRYTDKTKDFVDKVVKAYVESIRVTAQTLLDAVEARDDLRRVWMTWSHVLGKQLTAQTWRGEPIVETVAISQAPYVHRSSYGEYADHGTISAVNVFDGYAIVYGLDPKEYRKKVNPYLSSFMRSRGWRSQSFVFVPDTSEFTSEWVTDNGNFVFISSEELLTEAKAQRKKEREEARPKTERTSQKITYPVLDLAKGTISSVPYTEIPEGTPYYSSKNWYMDDFIVAATRNQSAYTNKNQGRLNRHVEILFQIFGGGVTKSDKIVLIGSNRKVDALEKRITGTYNVSDEIQNYINRAMSDIPERVVDIATLRRHSGIKKMLGRIKAAGMDAKIEDRELRRLINPKRRPRMHFERIMDLKDRYRHTPWDSSIQMPADSGVVSQMRSKYALLNVISMDYVSGDALEHMVAYLNAIHNETLTTAP